jgi:hypothetical protein
MSITQNDLDRSADLLSVLTDLTQSDRITWTPLDLQSRKGWPIPKSLVFHEGSVFFLKYCYVSDLDGDVVVADIYSKKPEGRSSLLFPDNNESLNYEIWVRPKGTEIFAELPNKEARDPLRNYIKDLCISILSKQVSNTSDNFYDRIMKYKKGK